jgi:hypothetical protein
LGEERKEKNKEEKWSGAFFPRARGWTHLLTVPGGFLRLLDAIKG